VRPIGEPAMSAWHDFTMMPTLRRKAFLNIAGASHLQVCY
jgi:hypothetical protein